MENVFYLKLDIKPSLEGVLNNLKPKTENREPLSYRSYKP